MTSEQIKNRAFLSLSESVSGSTNDMVVVIDTDGKPKAAYQITDITVDETLQAIIQAKADSVWADNTAVNIGTGEIGQQFYSTDNKWQYTCVANGLWTRVLVVSNLLEILLDNIDDSDGLKTISWLNTNYPSAQPPQRVVGVNGYYERQMSENWIYVKDSITPATAVTDATDATDVITQFNALLSSLRSAGILGK